MSVTSESGAKWRVAVRNLLIVDFFASLYEYRAFLILSVSRDLKKHYKRSILGYCWSMLHPLLMMVVLAVAFSRILGESIEDYPVFIFIGMLPFQFFASSISECLGVIANTIRIIDQVPAPKYLFPASIVISNLINFLLALGPLVVLMLFFGRGLPWTIVLLPLVLLPLFMATMGLALLFSVGNVFFEDTQHLTGILIQSLYFLSPVIYGPEHLPEWTIKYLRFNPMFLVIEFMRDLLFKGVVFDWTAYGFSCLLCIGFLLLGLWVFRRSEHKFIYFV